MGRLVWFLIIRGERPSHILKEGATPLAIFPGLFLLSGCVSFFFGLVGLL